MTSVLIVEDELRIRELMARILAERGYDVHSSSTAMDGLHQIVSLRPDLVLLDLGLPDLDGGELLKMVRSVSQVPVIVVTARNREDEIVRTLNAGADDYLVKPFSVEQVEARVRAVLRRARPGPGTEPLVVGALKIDQGGRIASLEGQVLDLTPKEFDLLRCLAERAGEVVTKRELLAEVWREPYGGSEKKVDVHLSWLRRKLGESASSPQYLHTVFGVGVKLAEPGA
jgi:DNA-binding response OmpR family regulator